MIFNMYDTVYFDDLADEGNNVLLRTGLDHLSKHDREHIDRVIGQ